MSDKTKNINRYNITEFKNIIPFMQSDPIKAKKKFELYLQKYPRDYSAYPYYASTLVTLGYFKEAKEILEYAKSTFKKNRNSISESHRTRNIVTTEIRVLSYQEEYEELYKLCLENYQLLSKHNIDSIHFYARKKAGQPIYGNRENNTYLFRQIMEYKESDFLEHIKKHLSEYNENVMDPNNCIFTKELNIEKIIEEIKKYLLSDKRIFPNFYDNVYIFKYDGCGTVNNKLVDYFKVACFHNTKNIITMCPVEDTLNIPYIDLNYLNQEHIIEISTPKVRRLTQIEKFNQRYTK